MGTCATRCGRGRAASGAAAAGRTPRTVTSLAPFPRMRFNRFVFNERRNSCEFFGQAVTTLCSDHLPRTASV